MNLEFALSERDLEAVQRVIGNKVRYSVPSDLSFANQRIQSYFVIGEEKWALVEAGEVRISGVISEGKEYKISPLVGNAILECTDIGSDGKGNSKRMIVRVTMQHAARYGY